MKHTLGQAAKECHVSKSTLSRWIKKGRISADPQEDGSFLIDASELNRIKELQHQAIARNGSGNPKMQQLETPYDTKVLQLEIDMMRERLNEKDAAIRELRQEKDNERHEKERLLGIIEQQTRLLTHHQEHTKVKPNLWKRVFR